MSSQRDGGDNTRLVRTGNKRHGGVFHTAPNECPNVPDADSFRPVRPGEVAQRDLRECQVCAGDAPPTRRGDERQCPKCDGSFYQLPRHLASCDGSGGDA